MNSHGKGEQDRTGSRPDVATMVRTLLGNGFILDNVSRKPGYMLFSCHRYDEFKVPIPYLFVLCESRLEAAAAKAITNNAAQRGSHVVVVEESAPDPLVSLPWATFTGRLGGPIKSWLPLDPSFGEQLASLGRNQHVPGVAGRPDDLFEEYVHVALQFLLANRVIRYGQERTGEALPDGVAFGWSQLLLLYDAKAYEKGYPVTRNSVRQFSDYVRSFHSKYETYLGRLHAFLVVSGHFQVDEGTLDSKSREMYADCGVPLTFMTADDLGGATALLAHHPTLRAVLNWREIFSRVQVTAADINQAIRRAQKDEIVR